jgi:hypothetical protein
LSEIFLEWCADVFGMTVRGKLGQLLLFCALMFVVGMVLSARWGLGAWIVPVMLTALSVVAARQVSAARDAVWRAACLSLDDAAQLPSPATRGHAVAPTARSLVRLAEAVDLVRRGNFAAAMVLVPLIERELLRPEEAHLVDAVRAMISVGLGATDRAARQAVTALPTGSDDLDATLGRTMITEAWQDPARLAAIRAAWVRAGVDAGPLHRLTRLTRLRIDTRGMESLAAQEAKELSDEARAIGDEELAAELDARGRQNAYR